jgi:hypothetical protein
MRFQGTGGAATARHWRAAVRPASALRRLTLEPLEERRLLAVLDVGIGARYATIQSAVDAARPGDVVLVGDGQYAESVDLSRMGIVRGGSMGDLVIRGDSQAAAILAPSGQAAFFNSAAFIGDLGFEQLTVSGSAAGAGTRGLLLNQFAGDLSAEQLVFEQLSETAIALTEVTGDVWIQSSLFERLGDSGSDAAIRVSGLSGAVVITGNDFDDVRGVALDLANGEGNESTWLIDNNRIYGDGVFFGTTVTGIRATLTGYSRTDLTLVNNAFDGLAGSAIDFQARDQAELQTRWATNSATSLHGSAAAQLTLRGAAAGVLLSDTNTWDNVFGSGMSLRVEDAARLRATVQYDAFMSIGDGQGEAPDDALTVTTAGGATGRVDLFLFNNSVSTVTGSGLRISAGGTAAVRAVIAENVLDETNTATAGGALVVEHASAASQASVDLRVEGNSAYRNQSAAYLLRQLGTAVMRLERAAGTAAAEIETQNTGVPVTIVGTIGTIPPGQLDASLPLTLGDTVWWDNGDGLQNPGEEGVGGVVIQLTGTEAVGGAAVNRRTQSDASGTYIFPGLAAGEYTLTLDVPFAVRLATAHQGTDGATDSDFDPAAHRATVVLAGPDDDSTVDAGLWRTWQNPRNPLDVDDDRVVIPLDVLLLVNDINSRNSRLLPIPPAPPSQAPPYLDVNGNGEISPQDVLIVINYLNGSTTNSGGEGEAVGSAGSPDRASGATVWYRESGKPGVGGFGDIEKSAPSAVDGRHAPSPGAAPSAAASFARPTKTAESTPRVAKRPASQVVVDDVDQWFAQLATAGGFDPILECA